MPLIDFFLSGILITSHNSPPITTTLEPCRVAPYVNVPANIRATTSVTTSTASSGNFPNPVTFSAFDPALISAAHQVNLINSVRLKGFQSDFIFQYAAAAMSSGSLDRSLFSLPQYPLNLATALATAHNKNSSIADLRMKAKSYVEALGLENTV